MTLAQAQPSSCRSRSPSTAAHFWRATRARQSLCRSRCPASRRACASSKTSAATHRGGRGDRRAAPERIAPRAPILARAAAATTSTQTTKRSLRSSRRSCAKRWSAAAFTRRRDRRAVRQSPGPIAIAFVSPSMRREIRAIAAARSHAVVPVRECPIAAPVLVEGAKAFAGIMRPIRAALRPTELSLFCDADESGAAGQRLHCRHPRESAARQFAHALGERIPALSGRRARVDGAHAGRQPRTVARWGALRSLSCCGLRLSRRSRRILPGQSLARRCARRPRDRWRKGELAWDLFAGVGLFARRLAASFDRVVAVESAPAAIAALEQNLRGTASVAVKADTLAFLRKRETRERPDLIVVDPPRTGLGAEITAPAGDVAAPGSSTFPAIRRRWRAICARWSAPATRSSPSRSPICFRRPSTWNRWSQLRRA